MAELLPEKWGIISQIQWNEAFWLKSNQPNYRVVGFLTESEGIRGFPEGVFWVKTTGFRKKPVPVVRTTTNYWKSKEFVEISHAAEQLKRLIQEKGKFQL